MADDGSRNEFEDELRRRARELFRNGLTASRGTDIRDAVNFFEESLALYRLLSGAERQRAVCLFNIGALSVRLGYYREAAVRYDESADLFHRIPGGQRDEADCLFGGGGARIRLNDFDGALKRLEGAAFLLESMPEAGSPDVEIARARCLCNIGICLVMMHERTRIPVQFEQALEIYGRPDAVERTGRDGADCARIVAAGRLMVGDAEGAVADLQRAQRLYLALNMLDEAMVVRALLALTLLFRASSCSVFDERARLLEEALDLAVGAALHADRSRFRIDHPGDRRQWLLARAQSVMDLALAIAAEFDAPGLISDLIAVWRTVGTLDMSKMCSHRGGDSVEYFASMAKSFAKTMLLMPAAESAAAGADADLGSAFIAGPAVGSQAAIAAHLPRRPGPRLLMPHLRVALADYTPTSGCISAYR